MADVIFYFFAFLGVILFTAYFAYSLYCEITRRREQHKRWEEFMDKKKKTIVHAHWEGSRCSNCKRNLFELFDAGSHLIKDFEEEVVCCPYCGAQMDEEVNNNGTE